MKVLILVLISLSNYLNIKATVPPVVQVPHLGKIKGGFQKSLNGRTFYSFEGVPYARPPVGNLRFQKPEPVEPWTDVWEAKTIYKCMQWNHYTPPGQDFVIGDEDCLYLNVYTPNLDPDANLDVVVYIHGGAFMFNWGGIHGPKYLLDKEVVVINLNYRLGPLGFLSTENEVVPGNNGMRDQIFALQFIKDNVKYFGGNPESVTTIGMSAGGASVHFHYLSPKSRNLFTRGISQSGCTLNPWVLMEKPLEKTQKLAAGLGCATEDVQKMVDCLKTRPGRQIVASVKDFQPWLYNPFSPFGLVVDSWSSDPVLPEHPYQLLKKKKVYDAPWIVSYTSSEGLYPAADFYLLGENYIEDIERRWNDLMPLILDYNYTVDPKLHDEVSQKIRQHYLKDKKVTRDNYRDFIPIVSDRIFVVGLQKTAKLQAAAVKAPIYSYYFTYRGAHSWSEYRSNSEDNLGASHGDDTAYVFNIDAVDTTTTEKDKEMIKFLVDLVTSFAKTGKPNVPVEWPSVSKNAKEAFTYLTIDGPGALSVRKGLSKNAQFWDSLPFKENEKLFTQSKDEL